MPAEWEPHRGTWLSWPHKEASWPGKFAGVPATGKEVRVPFAVHYDLADGLIVAGRVYFEVPVFLAQVGALPA